MKLYSNKRLQFSIALIYPVLVFLLLSFREEIDTWIIPMIISVVFCLLWKNIRYIMISTLAMWLVAVSLWYFMIEVNREGQFAAIFSSSSPWVAILFVMIVLIPEIIIVSARNYLIGKLSSKG